MILLIDNYDSFVFNLVRYLRELGQETVVARNDLLSLESVDLRRVRGAVISPGPCGPAEAGVSVEFIRRFAGRLPILGVCLGHQAIAAAFGGTVVRASEPVHGRTSLIHHGDEELFEGLPSPFAATRYHSLIVDEDSLPAQLTVIARTGDGTPMALSHQTHPIYGVQFHPESVLTESGHLLLRNFLRLAGISADVDGTNVPAEHLPERSEMEAIPALPLHW